MGAMVKHKPWPADSYCWVIKHRPTPADFKHGPWPGYDEKEALACRFSLMVGKGQALAWRFSCKTTESSLPGGQRVRLSSAHPSLRHFEE
jgi:hypothetical protein